MADQSRIQHATGARRGRRARWVRRTRRNLRPAFVAVFASAVVAAAAFVALPLGAAWAIPPGGPSGDTPGTSATVSPTSIAPCETVSFTVTGFPAGETLNVKIDDGIGFGDVSVQGSGVVHIQAIPASGTVHGSFPLPCNIAPGSHWLRFLASSHVDPSDPGKGTVGYTARGNSDFQVVASSGGGSAGGSGGGAVNGRPGGGSGAAGESGLGVAAQPGVVLGQGAEQSSGQGGVLVVDAEIIADMQERVARAKNTDSERTGETSSDSESDDDRKTRSGDAGASGAADAAAGQAGTDADSDSVEPAPVAEERPAVTPAGVATASGVALIGVAGASTIAFARRRPSGSTPSGAGSSGAGADGSAAGTDTADSGAERLNEIPGDATDSSEELRTLFEDDA